MSARDELAEMVARRVPCRNAYCQQHPDCVGGCHGSGTVPNTGDPMFEALYKPCPSCDDWVRKTYGSGYPRDTACEGSGYVRRSRAESALWEALKPVMIENDWILVPAVDGWEIWKDNDEIDAVNDLVGQGATPDDALASAEVARRKEVRGAKV